MTLRTLWLAWFLTTNCFFQSNGFNGVNEFNLIDSNKVMHKYSSEINHLASSVSLIEYCSVHFEWEVINSVYSAKLDKLNFNVVLK